MFCLKAQFRERALSSTYSAYFSGTSLTAMRTCVSLSLAAYTAPYVPFPSSTLFPFSSNSYSYCNVWNRHQAIQTHACFFSVQIGTQCVKDVAHSRWWLPAERPPPGPPPRHPGSQWTTGWCRKICNSNTFFVSTARGTPRRISNKTVSLSMTLSVLQNFPHNSLRWTGSGTDPHNRKPPTFRMSSRGCNIPLFLAVGREEEVEVVRVLVHVQEDGALVALVLTDRLDGRRAEIPLVDLRTRDHVPNPDRLLKENTRHFFVAPLYQTLLRETFHFCHSCAKRCEGVVPSAKFHIAEARTQQECPFYDATKFFLVQGPVYMQSVWASTCSSSSSLICTYAGINCRLVRFNSPISVYNTTNHNKLHHILRPNTFFSL